MKQYRVENAVEVKGNENTNTKDVYCGGYINAETAEEAIQLAIECIAEEIRNTTDYEVETTEDEVKVYDEGEEIESYYGFDAEEVE
ncbi:MAG: hypothetical protein ACI4XP_03225 [Acutalibacteraceae bacterium]